MVTTFFIFFNIQYMIFGGVCVSARGKCCVTRLFNKNICTFFYCVCFNNICTFFSVCVLIICVPFYCVCLQQLFFEFKITQCVISSTVMWSYV